MYDSEEVINSLMDTATHKVKYNAKRMRRVQRVTDTDCVELCKNNSNKKISPSNFNLSVDSSFTNDNLRTTASNRDSTNQSLSLIMFNGVGSDDEYNLLTMAIRA
ncbi:hypothetical protein EB796_009665 [Bugula neritina]|uniref:Uncharacterized protein n=1 Tax=Bugula neritina TaxID=10212 RepID=A0A7J7K252_BUGNE|nr:hypothetical protein EB796_009665 [Bugula neritina]